VDRGEVQPEAAEVEHLRRPAVAEALPFAGAMQRERSLAGLASSIGNRGFARAVARMRDGEGILSGGLVHPDVEAAIASASGHGRPLDPALAEQAGGALGDSFSDVRIHYDDHAAALNRAVSARAFTVGGDIFFGAGEYRPDTTSGRELLTHELAHVVQQRGAPSSGPLTVSQPGDALELDAESAARRAG
jgi:hypothetical protein